MEWNFEHIHLQSVLSTNTWCKENITKLDNRKIYLVSTDQQTQGKGQHGKSWFSPPSSNICMSFCFKLPSKINVTNIPQILSISCVKLLEKYHIPPQIKWPNDVLIDGEKIAGILCEISDDKCIVGIGVNINMTQTEASTIDQPATSLFILSGQTHIIPSLINDLKDIFLKDLSLFLESGFAPFHDFYTFHLAYLGQEILWKHDNTETKGVLRTVLADGCLELLEENQTHTKISYGQLRPICASQT
ncbi:MAG: biotin--[acetyl-CoA-carboxylase] ligase [Chlamydiales bacterium]|nr:biotin--[acetyl-CoA-carboxylase] ligase [Chlamydiales bacterium]